MQNKTLSYIGIALGVVAILIAFFGGSKTSTNSSSVLGRVISSGTLRAGYIAAAPYITKDPKTGELSGIFYDATNELAKQLGVKVEWVEEGGYGTIPESLSAGRYDVYTGIWANSNRAKVMSFSNPLYYDAVYAYARAGDFRFNNLDSINSAQTKISTIDGELGDSIAKETFPNAQRISLPQTSPYDQLELQVVANKADIVFVSATVANLFLKSNPNTLRRISDTPVRLYATTFGIKQGETNFQQLLNVSIQEIMSNGKVNSILNKYDPTALRVSLPYSK